MSQQALEDQAVLLSSKPMKCFFRTVDGPAWSLQSIFLALRENNRCSFRLFSPFVKHMKENLGTLFYPRICGLKHHLIFQKAEPDFDKGDLWRAAYKSDFEVHFECVDFFSLKENAYCRIVQALDDSISENGDFAYIAYARYSSAINGVVIDISNSYKPAVTPFEVRTCAYPWTCDEGY